MKQIFKLSLKTC